MEVRIKSKEERKVREGAGRNGWATEWRAERGNTEVERHEMVGEERRMWWEKREMRNRRDGKKERGDGRCCGVRDHKDEAITM